MNKLHNSITITLDAASARALEVSMDFFDLVAVYELAFFPRKRTGNIDIYDISTFFTEKMVVRFCIDVVPDFGSSDCHSTNQSFLYECAQGVVDSCQ